MDQIDEFESMFRRAERESFEYASVPIDSIAFVTDQSEEEAQRRQESLVRFMPALQSATHWRFITGDEFSNVNDLLRLVDETQTDLIVTYRHLQEESLVPQHSLGVYLDVLTQVASIPVLVLPGTAGHPRNLSELLCDRVMVVADHISGDSKLINYGVRMCPDEGTLWLCHVEDDAVFDRYMRAIERIPEIGSDETKTLLDETLQKEARDFIETCIGKLSTARPSVTYESKVTRGHFLKQYTGLIENAEIDLVVANTKDEDQLAMHGMAWSIAVELLDVALLLL